MTEPAAIKRTRTPAAIALAIMLLACALIVTALLLLAQGAVAYELPASDPSLSEPRQTIREPIDLRRRAEGRVAPARAGRAETTGSFALGSEPTTEERALQARISESSSGGGFVAGGRIHVVVEGGSSAPATTQR